MTYTALKPSTYTQPAGIAIFDQAVLALGRVHECSGAGQHSFAFMLARCTQGPIIWASPRSTPLGLNPDGIRRYINPNRLIIARYARTIDGLTVIEDSLRSAAAPVVIGQFNDFPTLTQIRRLHLASTADPTGRAPVTVLLTPSQGGCPGVETRWHMTPNGQTGLGDLCWTLHRTRARMMPPASWDIIWKGDQMKGGHIRATPQQNRIAS
jgi:protein ImuA